MAQANQDDGKPALEQAKLPLKNPVGENAWAILGGLRFVLAMIVLLGHVTDFGAKAVKVSWTNVGNVLNPTAAVLGFLIISGYSMAHSIENPRGFYRRRFWRIAPLYVFGLMFGYVVTVCAGGRIFMPGRQFVETPDVFSLVANVLFLQGWVVQRILINGPLWSISIEVFYYLLTPLFVRCRTKSIAAMICISAITFGVLPKEEYWRPLFGGGMLLLAWAWLAGFLLYRNRTDLVRVLIIGLSGLLASIILGGYATNTITISALLVSYAGGITVPRRLQNLLNYLGELSYPLYIIHWPTILGIYAICHISDSSVWIVGSLVMAILVYHAVDQPIRRRRKKQTRKELSASPAVVIQPASSG